MDKVMPSSTTHQYINLKINHKKKYILILFSLLFFLYANCSYAEIRHTCNQGDPISQGGWHITHDLNNIHDGMTIATNTFYQPITTLNVGIGSMLGLTVVNHNQTDEFGGMPLVTMPGLSLRWKWTHFHPVNNIVLSPPAPLGKVISSGLYTQFLYSQIINTLPANQFNRDFDFYWTLDLVVNDVKAYAGGEINFAREPGLGKMNILPNIDNIACSPVFGGFYAALASGGPLALPSPLPKPPTPTCQFPYNSLNRTITLPSIPLGAIPSESDSRAQGSVAEERFTLSAIDCGENTNFSIFFTDNNQQGSEKRHLSTTGTAGGKVGVRLYVDNEESPIPFGPAPTGSNPLPQNAAIKEGPTPANSTYNYDITAQYVRPQNITAQEITTGDVRAEAAITIIYP